MSRRRRACENAAASLTGHSVTGLGSASSYPLGVAPTCSRIILMPLNLKSQTGELLMDTSADIRRTDALRFAFLKFLYENWSKTQKGQQQSMHVGIVKNALGLSDQEADRIETYLHEKGLIEYVAFGPTLTITSYGIDLVERALRHPDRRTDLFPAINILNIESVVNSQIQQGTVASNQTGDWSGVSGTDLAALLDAAKSLLQSSTLTREQRHDLEVDVQTLETQSRARKLNRTIVIETLKSMRNIAEETGAALLAAKIAAMLGGIPLM
jgi:hypothetical protein